MQPSLEKLRKFFGLEREKGYDNTAIIGGLAKMLDYWEGRPVPTTLKKMSFRPSFRDCARTTGSALSPAPMR